jgi:hypothetical protein
MSAIRRVLLRLLHAFRPNAAESELEREVQAHLGIIEDEYRAGGMTETEARCAARRALGTVMRTKELHREARSFVCSGSDTSAGGPRQSGRPSI